MSDDLDLQLARLREKIDEIDSELLKLLSLRADFSIEVGRLKYEHGLPIFCPQREQQLLAELEASNKGPLNPEQLRAIYTEILSASRCLQQPQRVACLGPVGTFSYLAGQEYLGKSVVMQPEPDLSSVFSAVADGKTHLGMVPLENSLQGSVGQCLDLFIHHQVHIVAEFFFRVRHSLLSVEKELSAVEKIYSHPQPLAQCAGWLKTSLPKATLIAADSTARAAELAGKEAGSAAIGHAGLSELFKLNLLAQGIEDQSDNWTRFVVIAPGAPSSRREYPAGSAKSTLLFTLDNKPGSLYSLLAVFKREELNLSKLESRPARDSNWGYTFFADVEADLLARPELLKELSEKCLLLKTLGVYPVGRRV